VVFTREEGQQLTISVLGREPAVLAFRSGSTVQPGLTWVLGTVGGYALTMATYEIPLA
jgi:hypothetical protein